MPDAGFLNRFPAVLSPILAAFGPAAGGRLLDVGCGDGALTLALAAAHPEGAWEGVDLDPAAVAAAAASAGNAARFRVGDAAALPFPDAAFEGAFCNLLLHFRADRRALVAEMARVVRPGGRLVLSDIDAGLSLSHDPGDPDLGRLRVFVEAALAPRTATLGRALPDLLAAAGCAGVAAQGGGILVPGGGLPPSPAIRAERLRQALAVQRPYPGDAARLRGIPPELWADYSARLRDSLRRRLASAEAGGPDPVRETVSACGASGSVVAWGVRGPEGARP